MKISRKGRNKRTSGRAKPALQAKENNAHKSSGSPQSGILKLQRTIGNQAVQRLYETGQLQAKLKIGQPNDRFEREADSVADRVMTMAEPKVNRQENKDEEEIQAKPLAESITPLVQREVAPEEEELQKQPEEEVQKQPQEEEEIQKQPEEEEETAQAKGEGGTPSIFPDLESGINSIRGGGHSLPESTRSFMEPRFGADFSGVKVHTGSNANHLARSINAKAFTLGKDVVFGPGQYSPGTSSGKKLLAHELTHTVQQGGGLNSDRSFLRRKKLTEEFSGGKFSEKELQDYLKYLDKIKLIEDGFYSDNKAREVVRRWLRGDSSYILPVRRKILLIQEMLSGFTGDDDENAIFALLKGSTDVELKEIIGKIGIENIRADFHGEELKKFDLLLNRTKLLKIKSAKADKEVFDAETILELQQRFTSNAEPTNRLNCILIIRELAPKLFGADAKIAKKVEKKLGSLKGKNIKMTKLAETLSKLKLAISSAKIKFDKGNGLKKPENMGSSAWDVIIGQVGKKYGWHVFGMAVFDGYHSVTVLVDNRPDGTKVYWADQWRIAPGDDFYQEEGSVSGFRRYEKGSFDKFIKEKTIQWWEKVFNEKRKRYSTTLHIWKFLPKP